MLAGDTGFVSLADALRGHRPAAPLAPPSVPEVAVPGSVSEFAEVAAEGPVSEVAAVAPVVEHAASTDVSMAIRAARLFRAAVGDAFDAIIVDLVREIAVEIVARELRLADADVALIARRLIAEREAEEPLRLRVAAADAAIACELPVIIDPALAPGDAVLECRSGSIDARLGVRLAAVLQAVRA